MRVPDLVVLNVELNVRYPNTTIDDSTEYMFSRKYVQTTIANNGIVSKRLNQQGGSVGYTPNQYIDRIRFQTSESSTASHVFSSNGGTYA